MASEQNIWFFAEGTGYLHRNKGKARERIRRVIEKEGFLPGKINIIFCSDDILYKINLKYLNHNTLTDIVTFNLSEEEGVIEGDIYISIDRARENARKYRVRQEAEVQRLMIHGILHLAGYEDKSPEEKDIMTQKEDYYLSLPTD